MRSIRQESEMKRKGSSRDMRSFIEGVASLIDVFGVGNQLSELEMRLLLEQDGASQDAQALRSDWDLLSRDFYHVINQLPSDAVGES